MKEKEKDPGGVPPLLELRQVSRTFTVRDHAFGETRKLRAVSDVDLRLNRGDCLGLVGESGCGKSTLGRLACGLIPPASGQIHYRGPPLPPAGPHSSVAGRLQMVFQDPYSSLNPRLRVGRSVSEGLLAACFSREHPEYTREAVRDRTAEMFRLVGLAGMENRYPHEFSGGQRQRIALARALITNPDLVVCDEPVSALDASVQAQVLNAMRDLHDRFGQSLLFITHNLAVVGFICSRILVMYLGEIVEELGRDELDSARHPYTQALFQAMPAPTRLHEMAVPLAGEIPSPLDPPQGCYFHPRCPRAQKVCSLEKPCWHVVGPGHRVKCHFADQ